MGTRPYRQSSLSRSPLLLLDRSPLLLLLYCTPSGASYFARPPACLIFARPPARLIIARPPARQLYISNRSYLIIVYHSIITYHHIVPSYHLISYTSIHSHWSVHVRAINITINITSTTDYRVHQISMPCTLSYVTEALG